MDKLGFIGLGVMGEPMCRNLARRQLGKVLAYDLRPEPLKRLAVDGIAAARSITEVASQADVIFLSLPGEPQVRAVGLELALVARAGQAIVDCSTAPVALARAQSVALVRGICAVSWRSRLLTGAEIVSCRARESLSDRAQPVGLAVFAAHGVGAAAGDAAAPVFAH